MDGTEIILAVLGNPRISAIICSVLIYKGTLCYSVLQNHCPVMVTLKLSKDGVADKSVMEDEVEITRG